HCVFSTPTRCHLYLHSFPTRRSSDLERVHVRDEAGDVRIGGIEHDLRRRADLHDAPALHDGNAVADLERLVKVVADENDGLAQRSEEHTSELQSREISYAVFCLKKKK